MTTGLAMEHDGHLHEAGFYRSDEEFRGLVVPFVEEGIAAGQPVIVGYSDRRAGLLRSWLSDPAAVTFIADSRLRSNPGRAMATYVRFFVSRVAMGAAQIRVAADVPYPGNGGAFEGWDRYEAAINRVWQEYPVWGRCVYDATAPAEVHAAVERTHPVIVSSAGDRLVSEHFENGADFTAMRAVPDALEEKPPAAELTNPSALEVRRWLVKVASGELTSAELQDMLVGVSEAVANAQIHGRSPTTVRLWAGRGRVVVRVHDTGKGPADPLAGLIPPPDSAQKSGHGIGLWLMNQLDIDVTLIPAADGFTVRLRAGSSLGT